MPLKSALILVLVTGLTAFGCNRGKNAIPHIPAVTGASGYLVLTKRQIKALQLETTTVQKQLTHTKVLCNGVVALPASSSICLCAPMEGILQSLFTNNGNYVKAGMVLAEISGSAFLELQQEYLVKKSLLRYYEEDFKRQGELTFEDASSIKKLQETEADYRAMEVDYLVLGEKLALMGIDIDSLHIGNITSQLKIVAPVSGYLDEAEALRGSYVSKGQTLFRITDNHQPYLQLSVPESYADAVRKGQQVRFSFTSDEPPHLDAIVKSTGFEIDSETGTLKTKADISDTLITLLPGRTVYARIETGQDSAYLLPSQAIVHTPSGNYVIAKKNRTITRIRVETRPAEDGMTEILPEDMKLLGMVFVVSEARWLNSWIGQF